MNELNLNKATMSSLEIAELTGKRHNNVLRDIEKVLNEVGIGALKFESSYLSSQNKQLPCYNLPRRECDLVVSGYVAKYRLAIIDRWHELEAKNAFMPAAVPILTERELLQANLRLLDERDALKTSLEDLRIAGLTIVTELGCDLYFNVAAKILETNLGIRLGHKTLMELLRANGYLLMGTRSIYEKNMPSQKHVDLFRVILHRNEHTGAMTHSTVIRPEGLAHIAPLVCEWLWKHENVKRLSNGMIPLPPPRSDD